MKSSVGIGWGKEQNWMLVRASQPRSMLVVVDDDKMVGRKHKSGIDMTPEKPKRAIWVVHGRDLWPQFTRRLPREREKKNGS